MTKPIERTEARYTSFYCEENIWHLCQHPRVVGEDRHVLWMTNAQRRCAFRSQRSAKSNGEIVLWDYHVVLLTRAATWLVWDLDSVLAFPVPLGDYLDATFGPTGATPHPLACRFRVIPGDTYIAHFSSDRSHMRWGDGSWIAPPPDWPAIDRETPVLFDELLDVTSSVLGEVVTQQGLEARFL